MMLTLASCATPTDYIYVDHKPVQLPLLEEAVGIDLLKNVNRPLDVVRVPETVGDLLHNMQEYQRAYIELCRYSEALEKYIDTIVTIHNDGGIKDGTEDVFL